MYVRAVVDHSKGAEVQRIIVGYQNWRELFEFFVSAEYADDFDIQFGWKRKLYKKQVDFMRNGYAYTLIPLYVLRLPKALWFNLARISYEAGLFRTKPPAGEMVRWWWPRYFF